MTVSVSVLLCTVRGNAYADSPTVDTVGQVIEYLAHQTFKSFELIVVDGLHQHREVLVQTLASKVDFPVVHLAPREGSPWVRMKKVAISAYRNTGIAAAKGELIVNLDDTCILPPEYVDTFWRAWHVYHVALGMLWPGRGDWRRPGRVDRPGNVFGFGSYPRELAFSLNGYDEAYDGGQALEDIDWSTRLFNARLSQALLSLPGFDIPGQTGHDASAINKQRPWVKCCNATWQCQRVWRQVQVANVKDLWPHDTLRRLVGPCLHLRADSMCGHHGGLQRCAYLDKDEFVGFAERLDPEAAIIFDEPPVLDLKKLYERMK